MFKPWMFEPWSFILCSRTSLDCGLSWACFECLKSDALQVLLHVSSVLRLQCIAYLPCKAQTYAWCVHIVSRFHEWKTVPLHLGITLELGIQDFLTRRTSRVKCVTCSDHSCGNQGEPTLVYSCLKPFFPSFLAAVKV